MEILKHFKTVSYHKYLVMKGCFKVGLYWQGIIHDLSKYSLTEFIAGAKYYQGNKSPIIAEREEVGYSEAWMHHKGRNKHHYEYWFDYDTKTGKLVPVEMPKKYVVEMLIDRIAASKVYNGKEYKDSDPLQYFKSLDEPIHPNTRMVLEELLNMLAQEGEESMMKFIKTEIFKEINRA